MSGKTAQNVLKYQWYYKACYLKRTFHRFDHSEVIVLALVSCFQSDFPLNKLFCVMKTTTVNATSGLVFTFYVWAYNPTIFYIFKSSLSWVEPAYGGLLKGTSYSAEMAQFCHLFLLYQAHYLKMMREKKTQTFINKCQRYIFSIRWPEKFQIGTFGTGSDKSQ